MTQNDRRFRDFDIMLIGITLLIFIIGVVTIYSATMAKGLTFQESFVLRQVSWLFIGMIFLGLVVIISYQRFIDISYVIYIFNVSLLVLVLLLGHARLGAQRWFSVGGFAFQPSEFIKLSLILVLSNYVGGKKDSMADLKSLVIPCLLVGIPFVLVLLQPDLGTALLLIPIFFSIMIIGGADFKYLGGMLGIGLVGIPFFWHFLKRLSETETHGLHQSECRSAGRRIYDHTIEDCHGLRWVDG